MTGAYNLDFRFVEEFLDIKERGKSHKKATKEQARSLANLHNNEAGRRVRIKCTPCNIHLHTSLLTWFICVCVCVGVVCMYITR